MTIDVQNYTEVAVNEVIGQLYDSYKQASQAVCDCPDCRNRAKALSLNSLRPYYVATEGEYTIAKMRYDTIAEKARLIATVMDSIREASFKSLHVKKMAV